LLLYFKECSLFAWKECKKKRNCVKINIEKREV